MVFNIWTLQKNLFCTAPPQFPGSVLGQRPQHLLLHMMVGHYIGHQNQPSLEMGRIVRYVAMNMVVPMV